MYRKATFRRRVDEGDNEEGLHGKEISKELVNLIFLIYQADLSFPDCSISDSLRDLLKKLLVSDPEKRIALQDVLKHNWIVQNGY